MEENVFSKIGDEEVFVAVIVVVPDAAALSPAGAGNSRGERDIRKGSIAVVFEEARNRFLVFGKAFETPAVDDENIQPTVVVVVVESDAAAGGFEKIFIFVLAAVEGFSVEARFFGYVEEIDAKRRGFRLNNRGGCACKRRTGERIDVLKGKDQSGTA